MIALTQVRADTPGTSVRNHMNNAGASLMAKPVLDVVTDHLRREAEVGGYEAAAEATDRVEAVYDSVARLVGAQREEVAITESATVAWQRAFFAMPFSAGDRILTTTAEFAANYIAFLQVAKRTGALVEIIPDGPSGELDPRALEEMIDGQVRLLPSLGCPRTAA